MFQQFSKAYLNFLLTGAFAIRHVVAVSQPDIRGPSLPRVSAGQFMVAHDGVVSYAIGSVRHDETKERMQLHVDPKLHAWQEETSWHVLVQRRAMLLGVAGPRTDLHRFAALATPNIALPGVSACNIYEGLWKHDAINDISDFLISVWSQTPMPIHTGRF